MRRNRQSWKEGGFEFVGLWRAFDFECPDWGAADMPRLWRYNLHYFEFLNDEAISPIDKKRLIDSWIATNPPGQGDGWEPYPLSMRITSWIKHFVDAGGITALPEPVAANLLLQASWLNRRLEYHILGNHLLKNAKALLFAGALFEGKEPSAWRRRGERILLRELATQFLADGGHFERSPMYHAICLEDLLDLIDLMRANPAVFSGEVVDALSAPAARALDFLAAIRLPDGEIPLFSDSAIGIAPPPHELLAYGSDLLGWKEVPPSSQLTGIALETFWIFRAPLRLRHGCG